MTGRATLPEGDFTPVAIAAVGQLPSQQTCKIDLTMELPYGQVGDKVINRLFCGDLETETTVEVIGEPPYTGMSLPHIAWSILLCTTLSGLSIIGINIVHRRKGSSR